MDLFQSGNLNPGYAPKAELRRIMRWKTREITFILDIFRGVNDFQGFSIEIRKEEMG